jgi:hypothetical protein
LEESLVASRQSPVGSRIQESLGGSHYLTPEYNTLLVIQVFFDINRIEPFTINQGCFLATGDWRLF